MMISKFRECAGWDNISHPAFIWKRIKGKPYCKMCASKIASFSEEGILEKQEKLENTALLHKTMFEWWKSFGIDRYCDCCDKRLPLEFSVTFVHHLLPKSKYKDVALDSNYFMLLCADCHTSFEISPNKIKHKAIYERTKEALKKYYDE